MLGESSFILKRLLMKNDGEKISCVIFDLDGTLLDTSEGIIESVKYTIKAKGYPVITDDKLYSFVEPPLKESFLNAFPIGESEASEAVACFRVNYNSAFLRAQLYDGICELRSRLRSNDIVLAVATNKPESYALNLIKHFGLEVYFASVHGTDKKGTLKKEDIIYKCLKEIEKSVDERVLVGDTLYDAEAAANVSMRFLGVTYGFGIRAVGELQQYPYVGIAKYPNEIANILLNI